MHRLSKLQCKLFLVVLLAAVDIYADPVPARQTQGSIHAFLSLSTMDGKRLAVGDLTQTVSGGRVTAQVTFHFGDGSLDDETTVFTQRGSFRLVSEHHIQHGPSFPKPIDFSVDALSGQITMRAPDGKITQTHLNLPTDVANGLPPLLLMNLPATNAQVTVSFVAPIAKPLLIHLNMKAGPKESFSVGGISRQAIKFTIHPDIGGAGGVIAPLIGKQPADIHVWIMPGASPAFLREEGQTYEGGPIWRIEQISATFP